ncbi:MFS transporter [Streptomyces sp. MB09-02B]|nr:MFS transporter [Streptomyces sp. MB09-02B]MDX3642007.1 MFS transporter [Streptomyces sp. MB09-02B]
MTQHTTAWRTTWALLGFMLVNFADKAVMGLAAQPIMDDLGLTRAEFGTASAAFFALFSVSALAVPYLTRNVRTTVLLLVLALLWAAAQLAMLWPAAGFGTLVATHHLHGWFEQRERTLPTAVLLTGAAAGVAVAAPTLTLVIDRFGWRWAFGAVGLAGLVWAGYWVLRGAEGPYAPGAHESTGCGHGRRALSAHPAVGHLAQRGARRVRRVLDAQRRPDLDAGPSDGGRRAEPAPGRNRGDPRGTGQRRGPGGPRTAGPPQDPATARRGHRSADVPGRRRGGPVRRHRCRLAQGAADARPHGIGHRHHDRVPDRLRPDHTHSSVQQTGDDERFVAVLVLSVGGIPRRRKATAVIA